MQIVVEKTQLHSVADTTLNNYLLQHKLQSAGMLITVTISWGGSFL